MVVSPDGVGRGGRGGGRVQVVTRTAAGRGALRTLAGAVLVVVAVGGHLAPGVGGGEHVAGGVVGVGGGVAHLVGRRQGVTGGVVDRGAWSPLPWAVPLRPGQRGLPCGAR